MSEELTTAETWHPINGVWVHIQQITQNGIREYYTDGKLEKTIEVNENGTIKSLQANSFDT